MLRVIEDFTVDRVNEEYILRGRVGGVGGEGGGGGADEGRERDGSAAVELFSQLISSHKIF